MSTLLRDASELLEAAKSAVQSGQVPSEVTVLSGANLGVRVLSDCDWPLQSLLAERGADRAYRVSVRSGVLRVEGREAGGRCLLEWQTPGRTAHFLLGKSGPLRPVYTLTAPSR